jgi:ribose transport system substrate-binding protein
MKTLRVLGLLAVGAALASVPACGGSHRTTAEEAFPDGKTYGKYKLHSTRYDNADANRAKENAADLLTQMQSEKNLCLVGLWAYNPPAILSAVQSAKRVGDAKIVGFDEDDATLQGIKDGAIYGTVVQQPFEFGYQSVKLMAALAKDPNASLPKEAADGVFHVPHLVIKKDNVEEFHKKLKELKAPHAAPPAAGDRLKVGFVSNNPFEFWNIAEAGTRKAAADFEVEVLFRRPNNGSAAEQKQIIEDLLSQGVKAIAVSVIDPENQVDFLNKVADKVPLLTQDNDAPKSRRKCYIGTDNVAAGRAVGKMVKEVMPDGGTIGIFVGSADALNAKQRRQGVLEELNAN